MGYKMAIEIFWPDIFIKIILIIIIIIGIIIFVNISNTREKHNVYKITRATRKALALQI